MADRGEGELLGVVDDLGQVRELFIHALHVDGDARGFHVGQDAADRQLQGGQQVCSLTFLELGFEVPAQGLDHGSYLDQGTGGGSVVAVERQARAGPPWLFPRTC